MADDHLGLFFVRFSYTLKNFTMKEHLTGKSTIVINASTSQVWEALTKPELIKKYFFGTDVQTDWKVGNPIRFKGTWEGKTYEDKGTVIANEPNKLIAYKYWSSLSGKADKSENYQTVTYALSESTDKTRLTITQEDIDSEKEKEHSEKNWKGVLEALKKMLEKDKVSA
jgi:uncharacterized protein YndB with AHSA1/START domain